MNQRIMRSVLAAVLLSLLVLSVTSVASADAGSQTWDLDSEVLGDNPLMEREGSIGNEGQSGSIVINTGSSKTWVADEVSEGCTFPNSEDTCGWNIQIKTDSDWEGGGNGFGVEIGSWDGSDFQPFDLTTVDTISYKAGKKWIIFEIKIQGKSETVPAGEYLALTVTNNDDTSHTIYFGEDCSWLSSPCDDPSYPTPEVPSVILLAMGSVALAGFVWMGMRNRKTTVA